MSLKDTRKSHMGFEAHRWKSKVRTRARSCPGKSLTSHHSYSEDPDPLSPLSSWGGSSPKGSLGPETGQTEEMCRKMAGQTNSLAPLQKTPSLFSQCSLDGEARGAHGGHTPPQCHAGPAAHKTTVSAGIRGHL